MIIIHLATNGQKLLKVNNPILTSGDKNVDRLKVDCCSAWEGLAITAIFYRTENEVYYAALSSDRECIIPWEVLQTEGVVYLGIYGVKDDRRLTSEILTYKINKGAFVESASPSDPTPDIFDQFLALTADHVVRKDNPHGVTKAQIGLGNVDNTSDANKPVSTAQATAIAAAKQAGTDAQTNLNQHTGNKNNPHGVTASQVGAVPTSRTINGKALTENIALSASDVKAAPDSFGLGGSGAWVEDLNLADKCGYYSWTSTAQNIPFDYGNMFVVRRSDGRLTQIGIDPYMAGHGGIVIRHYTGAKWTEWEWNNPPMVEGTAYRTTERYNSKAVYTKMVDIGALPNNTTKTIAIGVSSSKIIRSFVNITSSSGTNVTSPYFLADGTMAIKHLFTSTGIQISTTADYTDRTATVQVWYTE